MYELNQESAIDLSCTADLNFKDIEDFLKVNSPNPRDFIIPTHPGIQLENARKFAETVPHGKFAFLTKEGGFCMRGYLTGGNGVLLEAGINFSYPFGNQEVQTIYGKPVNLSVFREADVILAQKVLPEIVQGNIMDLNDTSWFDKDFALFFLDEAIRIAS